MALLPSRPPLAELGAQLGWDPLPLTLEEARHYSQDLTGFPGSQDLTGFQKPVRSQPDRDVAIEIRGLCFGYGSNGQGAVDALRDIDLTVHKGEFVAVMGPNGAGKTTLLKQCIGLLKPGRGRVKVMGMDTRATPVEQLAQRVGYVPQNPNALLFADTVAEELAFTRRAHGLPSSDDSDLIATLGLTGMEQRYPRDLSTGERQRVALGAVLIGNPELILLDEPTRGLDYVQKEALVAFLQEQRRRGRTVVLATHDVELVAQCAERIILMGNGEITLDGPVREVMSRSPAFASQINRLFRDPRYLTVKDVLADVPPHGPRPSRGVWSVAKGDT